jgi:putative DNA primase/helicase
MGYYKNLQIELLNRRTAGLLKPEDKPKILWKELKTLTSGLAPGTHYVRCPYCGWDKERSNDTLEVRCTLTEASYHCHYCGTEGSSEGYEVDEQEEEDARAEKRRRALQIWDECEPIERDGLAVVYLRARGLELPPNPDAVLRWHWRCPFNKDRLPCMVAPLRHVLTDQITGIHRTHIVSARGGEAERRALGDMIGSAVKLWPLGESDSLAVGEGIETVLAAIKLGSASPPAWAMTVANNLARLPVIPQVKRLTILADNDPSGTGERVARELRRKWAGRDVVIRMPRQSGSDFNDLLRRPT